MLSKKLHNLFRDTPLSAATSSNRSTSLRPHTKLTVLYFRFCFVCIGSVPVAIETQRDYISEQCIDVAVQFVIKPVYAQIQIEPDYWIDNEEVVKGYELYLGSSLKSFDLHDNVDTAQKAAEEINSQIINNDQYSVI